MDKQGFDQLLLENTENKCVLPPSPSSPPPPHEVRWHRYPSIICFCPTKFLNGEHYFPNKLRIPNQ